MKTIESRKSKKNLKLILAMLVAGLTFTTPAATTEVRAELVDETDSWNKEGEQHNEDITPQEQEQHTQENIGNQNNGGETPAQQDAGAVVDNSQGGEKPQEEAQPVNHPEQDLRNFDDYKDDFRIDDNMKDEWDIKVGDEPTPTPTPNPTPNPTPENSTTTVYNPALVVTVNTPNPQQAIPHTGDELPVVAGVGAAFLATGAALEVIAARKKFKLHKGKRLIKK